ncbi:MAG: SusC/RagA family TonB-linked outer membrane protein, partial [Flavobacteriaceae bacterium]|nr:SusC/RagA family TonB-linked outer membrane protein [Flavobacteriaceae bacterium]
MKKQKLLDAKSFNQKRFSKLSFVLRSLQLLLLVVLFSAFSTKAVAQTTVEGNVKDSEGLPLPGVTVRVEGTGVGTQTDFDGNYSIDVPGDDSVLVFTFVGMTTVKRTVNGNNTINVTLENDQQALDEVVVVGYGCG